MRSFFKSKITFIILFAVSLAITAQQKTGAMFIETNIFPSGEKYNCYVSYKIPYRNLVFIKNGTGYKTGMTFTIEAMSDDEHVVRESVTENFQINEYEKTESVKNFLEGVLSLQLNLEEYTFTPIINLQNTNRTLKMASYKVDVKELSEHIAVKPIVLFNDIFNCSEMESFRMGNFSNALPYSNKEFFLMIPVKETEAQKIKIKIVQNENTVFEEEVESIGSSAVKPAKCNEKIVLQSVPEGEVLNLFLLKNFSTLLKEGKIEVLVNANGVEDTFELEVEWVDKPFSLRKPELAIELLQNIVDEETVEKILSSDEDDYYEKLSDFWLERDPIKETSFNEIMFEFYNRADFAIANYSTLDRKNGALSDRGRIYVKFGPPDDVVRKYADNNGVIEIWKYTNSNREFKFIDNTGLGNFTLL